jgi:hypothetical protein
MTALISFLLLGLIDSIGIIVAVFIAHYNESNAKGGMLFSFQVKVEGRASGE